MSRALEYLSRKRPEVMANYFAFLKSSGSHLDEKTRAIISVITKVDRQTENGLKQYVKRALKLGVSADEIIDALFVAFPTLGLSKIVWATDILLDMDLPEFSTEDKDEKQEWCELTDISAVNDNQVLAVSCKGRKLLVCKLQDEFKVYDAICPHQSTVIEADLVGDDTVVCSKHGRRFSLDSGRCEQNQEAGLREFSSKILNEKLMVFI